MTHTYATHLIWHGNQGGGTSHYDGYGRDYRVLVEGKPALAGSADPAYRGDATLHNPEDLFLASLAACHMLSYLALCARRGVRVVEYEDRARGTLLTNSDGGGRFESVTLCPVVTVAQGSDEALALQLHATAHARCFIANSCRTLLLHEPTVRVASASPS